MNIFKRWSTDNSVLLNHTKKIGDLERKNFDLERKILEQEVQIQEIRSSLKETQISLNIILNSYQSLAEEINSIYDAIQSAVKPSSERGMLYSLRDYGKDDDDDSGWN